MTNERDTCVQATYRYCSKRDAMEKPDDLVASKDIQTLLRLQRCLGWFLDEISCAIPTVISDNNLWNATIYVDS